MSETKETARQVAYSVIWIWKLGGEECDEKRTTAFALWCWRRGQHYVPRYLCSPVPMFPEPMFPGTDVPRYLCSPVPMFHETYVPRYLCSPVPMFPGPMFPGTYVPRFTANVLNFACVRVRMCVCVCERACACACVCA